MSESTSFSRVAYVYDESTKIEDRNLRLKLEFRFAHTRMSKTDVNRVALNYGDATHFLRCWWNPNNLQHGEVGKLSFVSYYFAYL